MSFLDKVSETVTTRGREITGKAKDTAEIASLRLKITAQEEIMKKAYIELGKRYYEEQGSDPAEDLQDACKSIAEAMAEVEDLEAKIKFIKGI